MEQRIYEVEGQLAQISLIKHMRRNSNGGSNAKLPPRKSSLTKKKEDPPAEPTGVRAAVKAMTNPNQN